MGKTALLAIMLLTAILPLSPATADSVFFQSEQAAQQHCPSDTVVWENTKSGVYHYKGQRWYGNTKQGAYVCKMDADQGAGRATRNGQ